MGSYANLMWLPIINALLTCGIIIARSIVTLDFAFGSGESGTEDSSVLESFRWDSWDLDDESSSHHRSSANTEAFFSPTRLKVFRAVHHFSLDIIAAVIALQMVVRIYQCQRLGSRRNGTNFVSLANFFGTLAFMTFIGHIVIWKILPWATVSSHSSVPRVITLIIPAVFLMLTSAYCILQNIISHLEINTLQNSPATTDNWSSGNRQSTRVPLAEKQALYLRRFCSGAVVLLSILSAVGMFSRALSPFTTWKILGAVVAVFFLTYIPLFKTIPCHGSRRHAANAATNYPRGTAQLPPGANLGAATTNYPTAHGQAGSLPPQPLPPPPGYEELYNNQGAHERILMTPVYVRPLGP